MSAGTIYTAAVDPGAHSAVCVLPLQPGHGQARSWTVPGEKAAEVERSADEIERLAPALVVVERLVLLPDAVERKTGHAHGNKTALVSLAESAGRWVQALESRGLRVVRVGPAEWTRAMGVQARGMSRAEKLALRRIVADGILRECWPVDARPLSADEVDAVLMAAWGQVEAKRSA